MYINASLFFSLGQESGAAGAAPATPVALALNKSPRAETNPNFIESKSFAMSLDESESCQLQHCVGLQETSWPSKA